MQTYQSYGYESLQLVACSMFNVHRLCTINTNTDSCNVQCSTGKKERKSMDSLMVINSLLKSFSALVYGRRDDIYHYSMQLKLFSRNHANYTHMNMNFLFIVLFGTIITSARHCCTSTISVYLPFHF